jgi:hypothetical protein
MEEGAASNVAVSDHSFIHHHHHLSVTVAYRQQERQRRWHAEKSAQQVPNKNMSFA